ncbi:MAG: hypothetical protein Q9168_007381 [Polycauliona sp. 1 TL-2023]
MALLLVSSNPPADFTFPGKASVSSDNRGVKMHVVIVGAGLGGLAAAIGIARTGHEVTILEKAAALGEPPNASRILKKWGLLDNIRDVSVQPSDLILRSYRDGAVLSKQNLVPYAEERYGAPYLHIHRADYHRILVAETERLGVKILLGSEVSHVDFEEPSVQLVGKSEKVHADIIIGADGLKSKCREAMLGSAPQFTGDLAYRIVVKASDMKTHPELQELVEKPAINFWLGPSAHAVCYLLRGGELYNIVLICPDNILTDTAKADVPEMRDLFRTWDPKLRALLELVQESCKWRLLDSQEMETWVRGKFALLGDACHATLPCLAQGAALAIEDGAVLGQLFSYDGLDKSMLLSVYEKLRKPRTTRIVQGSVALRNMNHTLDGPAQQQRDETLKREPFEGHPNPWVDPVFQKWLFGYDVEGEVGKAINSLSIKADCNRKKPTIGAFSYGVGPSGAVILLPILFSPHTPSQIDDGHDSPHVALPHPGWHQSIHPSRATAASEHRNSVDPALDVVSISGESIMSLLVSHTAHAPRHTIDYKTPIAMADHVTADQNRGPQVRAVTTALFVAATFAVIVRFISRVGIVKRISADDYAMIVAWVSPRPHIPRLPLRNPGN